MTICHSAKMRLLARSEFCGLHTAELRKRGVLRPVRRRTSAEGTGSIQLSALLSNSCTETRVCVIRKSAVSSLRKSSYPSKSL